MGRPRHVLEFEFGKDEVKEILDLADRLKADRRLGVLGGGLEKRSVALIFEKPSTRTRVSFEVAIWELGGNPIFLSSRELQLSRGEAIKDTARVLSRYVDAVVARVLRHESIVEFAKYSSVPVVNALSDLYHPCQILADLQTIREYKGKLEGLKIAWIGDGTNVCNTMLLASSLMGMDMWVACPKGYEPYEGAIKRARELAGESGSRIEITTNPLEAVKDADVVMTDTFVSMGKEAEREERLRAFLPDYQVNEELMKHAKEDAIFMHCLPARRGEEVTDEVIDGPSSAVWDEAENRLHTEKALLLYLLSKS